MIPFYQVIICLNSQYGLKKFTSGLGSKNVVLVIEILNNRPIYILLLYTLNLIFSNS